MRVLIDGDILRYQIGAICTKNTYNKFSDKNVIPAPIGLITEHVDNLINHIVEQTGAEHYTVILSGKGNFRFDIARTQEYKGNRSSATRPYHYDTVGNHILATHPHIVVDGIEADDYIGIEQRKDIDNTITASRDKDLTTFAGWHFRFACGEKQPEVPLHWITNFSAWKFFFKQMLIGDSTDNIPGCGIKQLVKWGKGEMLRRKGVGPAGADKMLSECHTLAQMYIAVREAYVDLFGEEAEERMLENARLLYIGQTPDNLFNWKWVPYGINDLDPANNGTGQRTLHSTTKLSESSSEAGDDDGDTPF